MITPPIIDLPPSDGFILSLVLWCLAWFFSSAQDTINFRYAGSIFEWFDSRLAIRWWKLNSRPWLSRGWWILFPFVRDGWHFVKWIKWVFIFLMASYLPTDSISVNFWWTAELFSACAWAIHVLCFNFVYRGWKDV